MRAGSICSAESEALGSSTAQHNYSWAELKQVLLIRVCAILLMIAELTYLVRAEHGDIGIFEKVIFATVFALVIRVIIDCNRALATTTR